MQRSVKTMFIILCCKQKLHFFIVFYLKKNYMSYCENVDIESLNKVINEVWSFCCLFKKNIYLCLSPKPQTTSSFLKTQFHWSHMKSFGIYIHIFVVLNGDCLWKIVIVNILGNQLQSFYLNSTKHLHLFEF